MRRLVPTKPRECDGLMSIVFFFAYSVVFFVGCTPQATLTIRSYPEGGLVVERETGKSWGMAPVTVHYNKADLLKHQDANGCYRVKGFDVRWVSGATTGEDPLTMCHGPTGNYGKTFSRDSSSPGLEYDLQFALQLVSERISRATAQAQEEWQASVTQQLAQQKVAQQQLAQEVAAAAAAAKAAVDQAAFDERMKKYFPPTQP